MKQRLAQLRQQSAQLKSAVEKPDAMPAALFEGRADSRAARIAALAPAILIDAGPGPYWKSGMSSSTESAPLKVTAKKGQTLIFRHADPLRPHGLIFLNEELVRLARNPPGGKPNAVLEQTDTLGLYSTQFNLAGTPTPQEIARFKVIADITTALQFVCLAHPSRMAGWIEAAPPQPDVLTLEQLQFQFNLLVEMNENTAFIVGILCDAWEKKFGPIEDPDEPIYPKDRE